ncbi:MAG: hypothetical protein KDI45_12420 [Candidatus Accumulibacter sp.]|nr:hypothetical protein [Accumulibacter sp.]
MSIARFMSDSPDSEYIGAKNFRAVTVRHPSEILSGTTLKTTKQNLRHKTYTAINQQDRGFFRLA